MLTIRIIFTEKHTEEIHYFDWYKELDAATDNSSYKMIPLNTIRKAGLRRIRFHDLRHTNVSILIASGQEIKCISEQAGYSSVQFTLDVYGHLMPTHRKEQANKLEGYLNGNGRGYVVEFIQVDLGWMPNLSILYFKILLLIPSTAAALVCT
ncbi:MAG: tyrosine-type recombinase/integrase [Deltaproteobacteria bacterium]|nr:tyrosine-type recombinase/integrase [Deltaproteobacteria bacterium]